jgi:thiamine biosynthesis lipoprotein
MLTLRKRLVLGLCCLCVAACAQSVSTTTVQERFFAMGTWVDVTFASPNAATTTTALREIEALLRAFERDYYPWADGELAQLNRAIAAGERARVSTQLAQLLSQARDLSRESSGLFEPGLGSLVELWGFHTTLSPDRDPPSAQAIAATLEASGGIAALEIAGNEVRSPNRGLKLDLGGIAKGAAVQNILALLGSHDIDTALVNAGGDLAVMGQPSAERPWRVGVRQPRGDGVLGTLELAAGEAAFTSGDYERYFEREGTRLHHLLDPRTGRPATHTQALTVISTQPVSADAAATALFVAGPELWRELATRLGVDAVLRVDASGAVETTPQMAARLQAPQIGHDILMGSQQ